MAVQSQYLAFILEQLADLPALRSNRMFGGVGLYSDGLFFGLIDDDTLFFKTGAANVEPYRARGMPRFMPFPDRPEAVLGYHQVPAEVIEDAQMLVAWARQAVAVALESRAAKAAKPRPTKRVQNRTKKPAKKPAKTLASKQATKRTKLRAKPRTAARKK